MKVSGRVWHAGMKDRFELVHFTGFRLQHGYARDRLCMYVTDRATRKHRVFVFEFEAHDSLRLGSIKAIREAKFGPNLSVTHWKLLPVNTEREQAKRTFLKNRDAAEDAGKFWGLIPLERT